MAEGDGSKLGFLFGWLALFPFPPTPPPFLRTVRLQSRGWERRESREKQINPPPPRRPRKAPEQPSAAKTCREISFPPRLPHSPSRSWSGCPDFHQDLFFLSPSSSFFFFKFIFPPLFLFRSALKKKIWQNYTVVSIKEREKERGKEKGGEKGGREEERKRERERREREKEPLGSENSL